jgi:hypothetical protein
MTTKPSFKKRASRSKAWRFPRASDRRFAAHPCQFEETAPTSSRACFQLGDHAPRLDRLGSVEPCFRAFPLPLGAPPPAPGIRQTSRPRMAGARHCSPLRFDLREFREQYARVREGVNSGSSTRACARVGARKKSEDQPHAFAYAPGVAVPRQIEAERAKMPSSGWCGGLASADGRLRPRQDRPFRAERGFASKRVVLAGKNRTLAGNSNWATAAALVVRRSSSTRSLAIWALMGVLRRADRQAALDAAG